MAWIGDNLLKDDYEAVGKTHGPAANFEEPLAVDKCSKRRYA